MQPRSPSPLALLLTPLISLAACGDAEPPPARAPLHNGVTMQPEPAPQPGHSGGAPAGGMPDQAVTKPSPLAAEAITLTTSKAPDAHTRLRALLLDPKWLDRLDAPEVVDSIDPAALQLRAVLNAVAPHAPSVLDAAAASDLYLNNDARLAALIGASGESSAPGPALVKLWRAQLDPDSGDVETTIAALSLARSDAAVKLLEEALVSEAFETDVVIAWCRDHILKNRQNALLLAGLERVIAAPKVEARRRAAIVESLFEYRPADWYPPMIPPPVPPRRADLKDDARARLRAIADLALREKLIDQTRRAAIETELTPP